MMLESLLGTLERPRYWRFQTELPLCNVAMDDASESNIQCLVNTATELVSREQLRLVEMCDALGQG
jgi:hypothetical protein